MAAFWFKRKQAAKPSVAGDGYRIPRVSFTWLLASVAAVILPHVIRMPIWLTALCLLCLVGRVLIYQGRMSLPSSRIKLAIVVVMIALIPVQYGRDMFSTDATVGVLLAGITLKLLEMQQRRDVLIVIYLCYFTMVAEFIYSQSILVAVYMVGVAVVVTSALMSLNQSQETQKPLRTLRMTAVILAQAVPLMAAFFLLFPRISPLWVVPLQAQNAKTGLSDDMSPGDIGDLARSAEVAFRVKFAAEAPDYSELYWRAITLDDFDGRGWRRGFISERPQFLGANANTNEMSNWYQRIGYLGRPYQYNVILEPTYENWIYTLQMPQIVDDRMMMRRDFQVDSVRRVTQRYTYDARSYLEYSVDTENLGIVDSRRTRNLPFDSNLRARQFAKDLRATVDSDEAYVAAVLAHFTNEQFFYTLSPPVLGPNPVDEFLFETRQGFCEHFASAFTYLMRAGDVPARVVTGYMGGEFNPYDGTLTVRQYDAHAWAEVWLPEQGWRRIDPTAAVAPQRVRQGSNSVLQQEATFMDDEVFTLMRFRNTQILNDLRLQLEMLDYAWNRLVLNYNQDMQFRLFNRLFGTMTKMKVVLAIGAFMLIMGLFIALVVFRKPAHTKLAPATRHYLHYCDYLASLGFARRNGESPLQYLERIGEHHPQWRQQLETVTREFIELAYVASSPDPLRLRQFGRTVKRLRLLN